MNQHTLRLTVTLHRHSTGRTSWYPDRTVEADGYVEEDKGYGPVAFPVFRGQIAQKTSLDEFVVLNDEQLQQIAEYQVVIEELDNQRTQLRKESDALSEQIRVIQKEKIGAVYESATPAREVLPLVGPKKTLVKRDVTTAVKKLEKAAEGLKSEGLHAWVDTIRDIADHLQAARENWPR